MFLSACTAESQIQNSSTMVMGAVVGVAVILLVVVAVLLLRKRLVTACFTSTSNACVIGINVIYRAANCVIMCHKLEQMKDILVRQLREGLSVIAGAEASVSFSRD